MQQRLYVIQKYSQALKETRYHKQELKYSLATVIFDSIPNVALFLKTVLTVTTFPASEERSFSKLKLIKN